MKKLILTLGLSIVSMAATAQTFIIDGRIENATGKTRVVMYEYNGTKWDTAYVGNFRGRYSLVLDSEYKYQIWFFSTQDSVKVLAVDPKATTSKRNIVDVDFAWKGCAKITKSKGKNPFKILLIDARMTPVSRPEDFSKAEAEKLKE